MTLNYHTYKEIKQQPRVWKQAYDIVCKRKAEISSFIHKYTELGYSIVLTGAGTSAYIGDALECALRDTILKGASSIATTDIITAPELYFGADSKVLLVSFARSGNSPESLGAIRALEQTAGSVAHIFITCNAEGELAKKKGDNVLCLLLPPETNDLSLAMTSSYSTMFLVCAMIANIDKIEGDKAHIEALADAVEKAMAKYEDDINAIAQRPFQRAVFLGSGALKGVAEESRLKLQELTDGAIMCAFDSFLGFRHGPKAVVHDDCLLVYYISPDPKVRRYELDLIGQIAANNKVVATVAVCQKDHALKTDYIDLLIELGIPEDMPARYSSVGNIFVAQMLGCFKSLNVGLCPDTPSVSGNISRVVEGVILYI
ncbi:MAG: SIS domain-containing protein [Bacteroidales bacterium]|nr:SIS domain-containing protein [Bacteroidales bacterium]